jgi:hypothetical protein
MVCKYQHYKFTGFGLFEKKKTEANLDAGDLHLNYINDPNIASQQTVYTASNGAPIPHPFGMNTSSHTLPVLNY